MGMSGETLLAGGLLAVFASFHQAVDRGYFVSNYQMSSSHFQMDNIIMVDGNYRWIPTRMAPPDMPMVVTHTKNRNKTGLQLMARVSKLMNVPLPSNFAQNINYLFLLTLL